MYQILNIILLTFIVMNYIYIYKLNKFQNVLIEIIHVLIEYEFTLYLLSGYNFKYNILL